MIQFRKLSAATCLAAALSMTAAPTMAAELPVVAAPQSTAYAGTAQWDADAVNVQRDRYYRGRHYRGRHYRGHRNRVDAGDVIAGILVLGGIAAIASAASKSNDERRYPRQEPRYRDSRSGGSYQGGNGLENAANICVAEIERNVRVENVDSVNRDGNGWDVRGTLYNGDGFACQIGNDGRVSGVTYGGNIAVVEDRQYDDARYYEARRANDEEQTYTAQVEDQPSGPQPAYPGGPVDGDLEYEDNYGG